MSKICICGTVLIDDIKRCPICGLRFNTGKFFSQPQNTMIIPKEVIETQSFGENDGTEQNRKNSK